MGCLCFFFLISKRISLKKCKAPLSTQDVYYKLCNKLKALKVVLKSKNANCFGDLRNRVLRASDCLDMAQKAVMESRGSAECLLKERECLQTYVSISNAEEAFLKQKARNQWLQLGDQNSAFFSLSY
jgi:hypothetical protein